MEHVDPSPMLTLVEVAEMSGAAVSTVRSWCRQGWLPSMRVGGNRLVREREARRFLATGSDPGCAHGIVDGRAPERVRRQLLEALDAWRCGDIAWWNERLSAAESHRLLRAMWQVTDPVPRQLQDFLAAALGCAPRSVSRIGRLVQQLARTPAPAGGRPASAAPSARQVPAPRAIDDDDDAGGRREVAEQEPAFVPTASNIALPSGARESYVDPLDVRLHDRDLSWREFLGDAAPARTPPPAGFDSKGRPVDADGFSSPAQRRLYERARRW